MTTPNPCQVSRCGQPLPTSSHSTACPDCWKQLDQALGDTAALADELDTTISRQTRNGSRSGPRSAETPLPFNLAASEALTLLHATLWPWVREGLAAHPETPLPNPSIRGLASALLWLAPWLHHHPNGHEAVEEILYAIEQARRAIDRAPDMIYAGVCGTQGCGTELYAVQGHPAVSCPVCGAVREVHVWRRTQLEAAADQLLTLSDLTRAVAESGDSTISRKRLQNWVDRGRLIRSGNVGGTATYRVGDVLDLLWGPGRKAV